MAAQIDVSGHISQRGAFQDSPEQPARPRLLKPARTARPASPVQPLTLHPQILQLRRNRRARRLRQAGSVLAWTAGSSALITLVMGGLLGLR